MAGVASTANLMETINSFRQSRILLTAYELKVFDSIAESGSTAAEIAKTLSCDLRAMERLLNALCAIGILEKHGINFNNTPLAKKFLVITSPAYMFGLMHTVNLWDTWSTLTSVVRTGKHSISPSINERSEGWLNAFIDAMHWRAMPTAPSVVSLLDLQGVKTVLDVGGGSGAYAMAFAAHGDIHATVFDLPMVVPITKKYIEQEGYAERVDTAVGDYTTDSLGLGYDLVFLSSIVHSNSTAENMRLVAKCYDALRQGGQIVVQDFLLEEDRTRPEFAALFAINMLVGTDAGDSYTESEVSAWLAAGGFGELKRIDTPHFSNLVVGRKI